MFKNHSALSLLDTYIKGDNLKHHCIMVSKAMHAYATNLNKPEDEVEKWWVCGLLHDLDWEMYPDEHPNLAINKILPEAGFTDPELLNAIAAHAPDRTGVQPESELARYLFACDELSGFMHAVSLMRPNGFEDMAVKSVKKKMKDKKFAENVPREDIRRGAELIQTDLENHILFLIEVFKKS